MSPPRGRQRDRVGVRPLAKFIQRFMAENKLTSYDDFRTIAAEKKMTVSGETFRKAATDGYRQPLNGRSVTILAAGLRTTEQKIRELDGAYWYSDTDRYLSRQPSEQDVDEILDTVELDKLLAAIARRASRGDR